MCFLVCTMQAFSVSSNPQNIMKNETQLILLILSVIPLSKACLYHVSTVTYCISFFCFPYLFIISSVLYGDCIRWCEVKIILVIIVKNIPKDFDSIHSLVFLSWKHFEALRIVCTNVFCVQFIEPWVLYSSRLLNIVSVIICLSKWLV